LQKAKEEMVMDSPKLLIVECGSQTTSLIARIAREDKIRSAVLSPDKAEVWLEQNEVEAIILSGGFACVHGLNAPRPPAGVFTKRRADGSAVHLMGICYGMQLTAVQFGGEVSTVVGEGKGEYGRAFINHCGDDAGFLANTPERQEVWMSHGDAVTKLPFGFRAIATTDNGTIAAMQNGHIWGVQFHPEVTHTKYGQTILENFLKAAGCTPNWSEESAIEEIREKMLARVGRSRIYVPASGGVDSCVILGLLAPVMGDRLLAETQDLNQLRHNELAEIEQNVLATGARWQVTTSHRDELAVAMGTTIDAAEKRIIFQPPYVQNMLGGARAFGAPFCAQGTLYPDKIESGETGGAQIKRHHNRLINWEEIVPLDPLEELFKDEVRAIARKLGLPKSIWARQPSPGPGLFIRVLGIPATPPRIDLVRWADYKVRNIFMEEGINDDISQPVIGLAGIRTTGVKGDGPTYGYAIVVRPVSSVNYMTADGIDLPTPIKRRIEAEVTSHPEIVRIWHDSTNKPPATIEFE
jgi:GMP synthase (glutamine-hydrolysing)